MRALVRSAAIISTRVPIPFILPQSSRSFLLLHAPTLPKGTPPDGLTFSDNLIDTGSASRRPAPSGPGQSRRSCLPGRGSYGYQRPTAHSRRQADQGGSVGRISISETVARGGSLSAATRT